MKITILAVGRTSTPYILKAVEAYLKRLTHYIPVELLELPDFKSNRSAEVQKNAEGEMLLKSLKPGDSVVLLDERGRQMTSVEFSSFIDKRMLSGAKRLVFMIGGPYGFSDAVYARADSMLSLSQMTFTHEMVRLFFVEQVYRAMTILRGEPYHHE